jgi:hypothetical protein
MGNTWQFELYLRANSDLRASVAGALDIARLHGYTVRFPFPVMHSDGWTETEVHSLDQTIDVLTATGGLVTLWDRADDDIVLSFRSGTEAVSFGADRSLNPGRDPAALKIFGDLEAMFVDGCTRLDAWFGYCTDEYSVEAAVPVNLMEMLSRQTRAIRTGALPPLLYSLNYFSRDYWMSLDQSLFHGLGLNERALPGGVLLRTPDDPPFHDVFVLADDGYR